MAIIKCKMCGGDMELSADKTYGMCEFCGSTMTLPKIDDDQRAAAFNRGNHFRRIGEFDKALAVYERIVRENEADAEAHWCCALCRFGIEYVEDPATYEWIPTCHRASFDSFLEDVDYLAAVEYSDGITQRQYRKDAARIAEVQRGILATSQNEEPYDVFICYKETDEQGERTRDSLMAQDIYYQLTEQGRRVFFARITLEDIVGKQYEPYIFAALNSAKVMIVVGTKPEHLNAVWVKNEWSRFLAMMRHDRSKLLLPCYRDMDPYDLPEQLSVLQSYDMSKIGFIQDLTRGISKVLDAEKRAEVPAVRHSAEETTVRTASSNASALLERAFLFLEDKKWQSADEYCERVLDQEPKNAGAYLGKLLAERQVSSEEELREKHGMFDRNEYYQKVVRFGDPALKDRLKGIADEIYAWVIDQGYSRLGEGNWHAADVFFVHVLEQRPDDFAAHLGRMLADLKIPDRDHILDAVIPPEESCYFQNVCKYADAAFREELLAHNRQMAENSVAYIQLCVEKGNMETAEKYCNRVLEKHPDDARAYLYLLMIDRNARRPEELAEGDIPLEQNAHYQKILQLDDPELRAQLEGYNAQINHRNRQNWCAQYYKKQNIEELMKRAITEHDHENLIGLCEKIEDYAPAREIAERCRGAIEGIREKAASERKDRILQDAADALNPSLITLYGAEQYRKAAELLRQIPGWKDADERLKRCLNWLEDNDRRVREKRRRERVCQHCGGEFKGLFTKVCTKCGKEKDY